MNVPERGGGRNGLNSPTKQFHAIASPTGAKSPPPQAEQAADQIQGEGFPGDAATAEVAPATERDHAKGDDAKVCEKGDEEGVEAEEKGVDDAQGVMMGAQ